MSLLKELTKKLGRFQTCGNNEYRFECPRCNSAMNKYHLWINLRKYLFNCFRCKFSGHVSRILGDETMRNHKNEKIQDMKKVLTTRNEIPGFTKLKPSDSCIAAKRCRKYLKKRGIEVERWLSMKVGYSTNFKIADRLIIPIYEGPELLYFVARSVDNRLPKEIGPKTDSWSVPRSQALYGYDEMVSNVPVVIVEGIFDYEWLKNRNYNTVSILGSYVSHTHIGKILSKHPTKIISMFDGDYAGKLAGIKLKILLYKRYKGEVQTLQINGDPDELSDDQLTKYLDQDTKV